MPNRLANADSPYLKQHQDNPVDWFPWGDEAFARAKAENKPIFLSVGYSSCHWCHVMAHESFEADDVAEILNQHFISVKVDREERPDVDEAYMTAVQLYSGRGGWPMSLFLTSDGKPIFAGTYFPKENRGQYPGFKQIATQLATMWRGQRGQVEEAAEKFTEALRQTLGRSAPATFTKLDQAFVDGMVKKLLADFDPEHGGFGQAPKFPPHSAIELFMAYVMSEQADAELAQATFGAAVGTLQRMALGGIHDHVGGGFHRYSTDREWLLPHFEKMLYDNALLLGNYARAAALLGEMAPPIAQFFSGVAGGIAMWMQREMLGPDGLFFSALDADSEGEEGKFYTWTVAEVKELLGAEAEAFIEAYGFALGGNFKDEATRELTGQNIPHLDRDTGGEFDDCLDKLLTARARRVRPGTDDKALVGWNGLALAGMAEAGMAHLAEVVALALLKAEAAFGELPHQVVRGNPSGMAFLEDYAYVADGLFMLARAMQALHEFGGEGLPPFQNLPTFYREHAERLTKTMVERFYDEANGGFYSTSAQHEPLFGRTKPVFDQPSPSANSRALRCLAEIGDSRRIAQTQEHLIGWVEQAPGATEALLTVFLPYAAVAPVEPVVVKPTTPPSMRVEPREIQASARKGVTRVIIDVPEGLHLNSPNPPARWLEPTKVTVNGVKGEVRYPEATNDQYVGQVVIEIEVELPSGRKDAEFELQIAYQACTDRECLEPVRKNVGCVIFG